MKPPWNLELTLPKTNMDTQNDGLEEVTPFKKMAIFSIYSLDFWGVKIKKQPGKLFHIFEHPQKKHGGLNGSDDFFKTILGWIF